jgi:hypothetical protein
VVHSQAPPHFRDLLVPIFRRFSNEARRLLTEFRMFE